ncbi:YjjG family noncanonical pyrimidine nucleotidase [Sinomicrobium weinanense]|uniref:Noncanonical pyrimidine nucleotidase, YjjG family n=1 Tax=Sinomicrobium weinanense TaxID=2842200 RepID=A0A926JS64_9FLAO|nr:YjjG family noncanonical pyrimidine nucleotidase [Sinomicrobium weinanense]MBC9796532.1 noncanonical pyrimidine nucleotidase, YjjG family [Sinomicrobium weinanense]MBU3123548.1 YjjG family noncanonical pyrimidine nucleotidase [Sinomicrobium weinanense]
MQKNGHWKNNNEITDVFFDLDHTLWDFEKNSALAFSRILEEHSMGITLEDFLKVYVPVNHRCWKEYREGKINQHELRHRRLQSTFSVLEYPVEDRFLDKLSEDYIHYLPENNHLLANAKDILSYLESGYRLHIITNGFEEVQDKKLANAGIGSYFVHVVNSEMAGVKKPHPAIFEYALQKAGIQAGNAVMIGDDLEADVLGAINAGMHAIHYNTRDQEKYEGIVTISDLLEIKEYL